ncbi:MAG TPA: hypothetical protein VK444_01325 [Methanobacteriaceae archaeon]|nr:hypothetical protein [Methanobacteriaceae archaeon]
MDAITLGILSGAFFGLFSALIMVPMKFETNRKKWEAISSAFVDRFMIGLIIPNITFGLDPLVSGLIIGIGLSLPSAIISRAYAPIMIIGALGGLIIGYLTKIVMG